jgi:hypothetical protein
MRLDHSVEEAVVAEQLHALETLNSSFVAKDIIC